MPYIEIRVDTHNDDLGEQIKRLVEDGTLGRDDDGRTHLTTVTITERLYEGLQPIRTLGPLIIDGDL